MLNGGPRQRKPTGTFSRVQRRCSRRQSSKPRPPSTTNSSNSNRDPVLTVKLPDTVPSAAPMTAEAHFQYLKSQRAARRAAGAIPGGITPLSPIPASPAVLVMRSPDMQGVGAAEHGKGGKARAPERDPMPEGFLSFQPLSPTPAPESTDHSAIGFPLVPLLPAVSPPVRSMLPQQRRMLERMDSDSDGEEPRHNDENHETDGNSPMSPLATVGGPPREETAINVTSSPIAAAEEEELPLGFARAGGAPSAGTELPLGFANNSTLIGASARPKLSASPAPPSALDIRIRIDPLSQPGSAVTSPAAPASETLEILHEMPAPRPTVARVSEGVAPIRVTRPMTPSDSSGATPSAGASPQLSSHLLTATPPRRPVVPKLLGTNSDRGAQFVLKELDLGPSALSSPAVRASLGLARPGSGGGGSPKEKSGSPRPPLIIAARPSQLGLVTGSPLAGAQVTATTTATTPLRSTTAEDREPNASHNSRGAQRRSDSCKLIERSHAKRRSHI
jgi:hypothetical protein